MSRPVRYPYALARPPPTSNAFRQFEIVLPSSSGVMRSQSMVDPEQDHERILNVPHNYKLRSILQDQTNPLSDDPSPHLSKATFFPWTKASIQTLWGGGRASRMPWRGGSEDQPPEDRWERVVKRWKDCMVVCAVHTRGNKLREVVALTVREVEQLRTATWALEFDTLHPLVCVAGDTGIIHVFDVESWEMVGALTGHGGTITHLTTHRIRPDYILSTSHDLTSRMWSLADPVNVPTMPVFWPGQKKVHSDLAGDLGFSQMTIGQAEPPQLIPFDALIMRTGPPGGVLDPDQAGKGKGACIAVFKGAGNVLGGHDSWVTYADFHPTRPFVVTCGADRAIKIWRVPDFPTPETRPERGVNYHIVERPLFSCTHLHETGIEYVSWLKEDVLVSVSSNYERVKGTDEDTDSGEEDQSMLDVSGTIVVWQWLDLNRFAPEGLDIKEPLVKPSHWDWTESRSYLTLCKIFLYDEEEYPIKTSWSITSLFGSPLILLADRGNTIHIIDIQKYNRSPEEVKSRMRDPEKWASRRGGVRREVQHGNRAELSSPHKAQLTRAASRCIRALSDSEALQYSDEEILAATEAMWTSDKYGHYRIRIKRPQPGDPPVIELRFECIHDEPRHSPFTRHWKAKINGSLWSAADRCDARRRGQAGANAKGPPPPWVLKRLASMSIQASLHRILPWPIDTNSSTPRLFIDNIDEDSSRLSAVIQNLNHIYPPISAAASRYFQRLPDVAHLIIDGWITRTPINSLARVAVAWQEDGVAFRSILDVAWVSDLSPENYVANFTAGCLARYGLKEKAMGLMVEALTSFLRPLPRVTLVKFLQDADDNDMEVDDLELDTALSEREYNSDLVQEAIRNATRELIQLHPNIDRKGLQAARNVLRKVTALEHIINQANPQVPRETPWGHSKRGLVSETHGLATHSRESRQWGTIHDSMTRYFELIPTSQNLVAAGLNVPGIEDCYLSEFEQNILSEFNTVLEAFSDLVGILSRQDSPFLHEVVTELSDLRTRLENIRNGSGIGTSLTSITRVAIESAIWAYKLMAGDGELPEIGIVAVVMHPAHKLEWFSNRKIDTGRVRAVVIEHFRKIFLVEEEWVKARLIDFKNLAVVDDLCSYLDSPTLSKEAIEEKGGVLNYWNHELEAQPRVARMALDYLTIPGESSSVDSTRWFSGGQIPTNGLEKHMDDNAFRAIISVGSWFGTPVLPDIDSVANLLLKVESG
ncbi:unnamed protein product [Rhizoctonia solani]|uniref:Uncharacterized protein n=1 Tax=Rhizoctonia solani TaxID=456999 RepID=A0A8H3E1D9_9AGAM|nr:unnamed protein product [Rhizoctonia solani]